MRLIPLKLWQVLLFFTNHVVSIAYAAHTSETLPLQQKRTCPEVSIAYAAHTSETVLGMEL